MKLPQWTAIAPALALTGMVLGGCSFPQTESPPEASSGSPPSLAVAQTTPEPSSDQPPGAAAQADTTGTDEAVSYTAFAENGVAIRGADAVAYFTQNAYVAGDAAYTHTWAGATWQFSSAENRDRFARNPEAYAPQYGGYCAWAVSQGYTAPVDPNVWRIVEGKLYLNYNRSVQRKWDKDIPGHIAQANQNWPAVLNP